MKNGGSYNRTKWRLVAWILALFMLAQPLMTAVPQITYAAEQESAAGISAPSEENTASESGKTGEEAETAASASAETAAAASSVDDTEPSSEAQGRDVSSEGTASAGEASGQTADTGKSETEAGTAAAGDGKDASSGSSAAETPAAAESQAAADEKILTASVKDAEGNTVLVTVTCGPEAGIPDDAVLSVKEVPENQQEKYLDEAAETLLRDDEDYIFYSRLFDISILSGGKEVQPQAKVDVSVRMLNLAREDADAMKGAKALQVVHYDEEGTEIKAETVKNTVKTSGTACEVAFETDGFSIFGISASAKALLSWISDTFSAVVYGLTGINVRHTAVGIDGLESGLEVLEASNVSGRAPLWVDITLKSDVSIGPRESVSVYGLKNGALKSVLYSGLTMGKEEIVSLGSNNGFAVIKDTGFRQRHFELTPAEGQTVTLDGMIPTNATAKAADVLADQAADSDALLACDISLLEGNSEYEPDEDYPVEVSITDAQIGAAAAAGHTLQLVHILDDGTEEEVTGFTVNGNTLSFTATGFSVYVIIDHEGNQVVTTPRVEFHYISQDYTENDNNGTFTYTAPGYQFLNKAESNDEYQVSQILVDGESLEQVVNPPNKKDDQGHEASFFYGWYTVHVDRENGADTMSYDSTNGWTGSITYTWPDPERIRDRMPISIVPVDENGNGKAEVGETVEWTIDGTTGTAVLDSEGLAHVYIVPVYEDYYFINYHMGNKESDEGLRNNLLTRRLVVFGQNDSAIARIGNIVGPSPDPAHQIFSGWETVVHNGGTLETGVYYHTIDNNGNERNALHDGTTETETSSGGYRVVITKSGHALTSLDLYPVFAEARWLYYVLGKTGNGAVYVPAAYRLTNDDDKGTFFANLATTSRPGYDFGGWWTEMDSDYNGTGIQLTDASGSFVPAVLGQTFYGVYSVDGEGVKTLESISTTQTSGAVKIFEITSEGKMYFYKDIDSLTVYAKWTPHLVDYTVVYWLENADDDDYTLMYYKTLQGISGEQTAAQEAQPTDTFKPDPNGQTYYPYEEYKLKFAHLASDQDKEQAGAQSGIQQKEIEGDGSTIINVYYDRNVYRLRFDIGFSRTQNGTLSYSALTASELATYSGVVYGLVDGNYVALTSDGSGGWTYPDTVTVRNSYDGYRYQTTTGNTGTQYGVVGGRVVDLSYDTVYTRTTGNNQYRYQVTTANNDPQYGIFNDAINRVYYNNNAWRQRNNRNATVYTGTRYTRSDAITTGTYSGDVYHVANNGFSTSGTGATYGYDGTYYFPIAESSAWTYDSGTTYTGTYRYLRVDNGNPDTSYTFGFINGSMETVSQDAQGWYYNTQESITSSYTGDLYKQTITGGTTNYYVSNLTNSYNSNTDRWENFLTQNTVNLGTTNPFSASDYTGTYISGTEYTVYYYDIVAKYGENILDLYPGSQLQKTASGGTTYSFVGWIPQADSFYWEKKMSSIKGFYETMSEDLILTGNLSPRQYQQNGGNENADPDDYSAVTVNGNNTVTGEYGITHELRCRYKSGGGYNYLYRIYLANPETGEYPAEPTYKIVVTAGSGSTPNLQTAPSYEGYTKADEKVLTSATDTTGVTPSATTYSYAVTELTEAGVGNGMVMVYKYQPNVHHISYKYGSGAPTDLINTEFATASLQYNYGQSLANANVNQDAAVAATPEGHSFKGWYTNPDGMGSAFDFNSTMPDGDIVLYAVYSPNRYRVQIDPNGAEIDHIDHTGAAYTGTYGGVSYSISPFNRAANGEREADSGYNRSQATYFNGTYGEKVGEYTVSRSHVPIGDVAAEEYEAEGGRVYYYVNMQYSSTDGSGVPSDLRSALYIDVTPSTPGGEPDETELRALYDFWHAWAQINWDLMPSSYPGMTAQDLSYDAWKSLYVTTHSDGVTPQLYRKCNSKETWVFLGWFKEGESTPYNFADPVTEAFTLEARWRLDGGYTIEYIPEYWLDAADENRYLIDGNMDSWVDPEVGAETLSYTDGAKTTVYKQPTDITRNNVMVDDGSIVFLGWQLVSVHHTYGPDGTTILSTTYTPLEEGVYYDPGDDFIIDVQYADTNNVIHMQAVYEERISSVRRPEVANLTLDANSGYLTTGSTSAADGTELTDSTQDFNVPWTHVGRAATDYDSQSIKFGDIQSNTAVHLYRYATTITEDAAGNALTDAVNYFSHAEGFFLLGFDPQRDPEQIVHVDPQDDSVTGAAQPYVPNYPADSVISVQRTDNKTLYAIWEPMVYLSFVNNADGPVTFGLSTSGDALEIVNMANGMYERSPISDYSSITLAAGDTLRLAVPKGAEKDIIVTGTNNLGVGKSLIWNSSVELDEDGQTYATDGSAITYDHTYTGGSTPVTHTHTLPAGKNNNTETFTFTERLIVNSEAVTVTFTSINNDYSLVLDDNWPGGGLQEYDYALADIKPEGTVKKTQVLPSTSTRMTYEFQGWAYSPTATTPDFYAGDAGHNWTIPDLDNENGGFFSEGCELAPNGYTQVRKLYAVWKYKEEASYIYVYKNVPEPGNQKLEFNFSVELGGTYTATGFAAQTLSASGSFSLAHNEYAELHTTNSTTDAYIRTEITLYGADGQRKKDTNGDVLPVITITASGTPHDRGTFNNTEHVRVEELKTGTYDAYYDTTITRQSQVNNTNPIMVADNTNTMTNPLENISGTYISWTRTDTGGTVIFTNTRQTRDVILEKELVSTASTGAFNFSASYTADGAEVDLGSFSVTSGTPDTTTLADIPRDASLTVTEDTYSNYKTTVKVGTADADEANTKTFTVADDTTVKFTNTLKSYPVKFVKIDQNGTAGVVEAMFRLDASNHNIGTNLLASAASGSDGVFYSDETAGYEPFYAGDTYTLTETFHASGYIGLDGPVTIEVSGDETNPFTISDGKVTAEKVGTVWVFKVKNQEEKDIRIQKTYNDPLVSQRTFNYTWSYQFDSDSNGTIDPDEETFSGSFALAAASGTTVHTDIAVPVGAVNMIITETVNTTLTNAYDISAAGVWATGSTAITDQDPADNIFEIASIDDAATVTFTNTRKTVEVTVVKTVSGTGGTFGFTALLQYGSSPVRNCTLYDDGTTTIITGSGAAGSGTVAGEAEFTLTAADNGSDQIVLNVPYGANLTITETSTTGGNYTTTTQIGSNTASAGLSTGQVTITEATTITFTNTEVIIAPTGVNTHKQNSASWLMLAAGLFLALAAFMKRRFAIAGAEGEDRKRRRNGGRDFPKGGDEV